MYCVYILGDKFVLYSQKYIKIRYISLINLYECYFFIKLYILIINMYIYKIF
jgi:hypothetical protein